MTLNKKMRVNKPSQFLSKNKLQNLLGVISAIKAGNYVVQDE